MNSYCPFCELVVKGFNDRFKAVTALTLIDSLINSFSNEPLELEDYDLILYLKKKETEQIRKKRSKKGNYKTPESWLSMLITYRKKILHRVGRNR